MIYKWQWVVMHILNLIRWRVMFCCEWKKKEKRKKNVKEGKFYSIKKKEKKSSVILWNVHVMQWNYVSFWGVVYKWGPLRDILDIFKGGGVNKIFFQWTLCDLKLLI